MKTTLTLITIITSLFFSACANNNRAEYQNPSRAANASLPQNQGAQAQIDPNVERMAQLQINLMRDQFTKTMSIGGPDGGGLREH
jgi:hypothetical protein